MGDMADYYNDEAQAACDRDAEEVRIQLEQRRYLHELKKKGFFILWNPASRLPPRVQFDSIEAALKVAVPLARREKQPFFVLSPVAIAEVEPTPIRVTRFKDKRARKK